MKSLQREPEGPIKSPYNDEPFLFSEYAKGNSISFEKVCALAELPCVVTFATPLDIRIYAGSIDFIAVRPGEKIYCLAHNRFPLKSKERARYILERLAYGAREWASFEVLSSERRRQKYNSETEKMKSPEMDDYKQKMRETLPVRRVLREHPFSTESEIARMLNLPISRVSDILHKIATELHKI